MPTTHNLRDKVCCIGRRFARAARSASARFTRAGMPLILSCCTAIVLFGQPILAFAAAEEVDESIDGRLEGYTTKVVMEGGGTGLTWIGFLVLAVICVSALFKSAKRSHLD
jgi:hypothetical protein